MWHTLKPIVVLAGIHLLSSSTVIVLRSLFDEKIRRHIGEPDHPELFVFFIFQLPLNLIFVCYPVYEYVSSGRLPLLLVGTFVFIADAIYLSMMNTSRIRKIEFQCRSYSVQYADIVHTICFSPLSIYSYIKWRKSHMKKRV